uniref:Uncharacterized protein n=1 Tax=Trypanosoma congolense (strain IL3000) TaxID=1068625 RepID=G0V0A1_TRYCI|nr:hypothetical protein, unlikely [Trypanosoma congolense IL3000]
MRARKKNKNNNKPQCSDKKEDLINGLKIQQHTETNRRCTVTGRMTEESTDNKAVLGKRRGGVAKGNPAPPPVTGNDAIRLRVEFKHANEKHIHPSFSGAYPETDLPSK